MTVRVARLSPSEGNVDGTCFLFPAIGPGSRGIPAALGSVACGGLRSLGGLGCGDVLSGAPPRQISLSLRFKKENQKSQV